MTIYGIKNCNTVKNALAWLQQNNIGFEFHDYKTKGVSREKLKAWCDQVGWESLINKKGTTWKQLDKELQQSIASESAAIDLMMEKTSLIKRPLVESNGKIVALGFDPSLYSESTLA